MTMKITQRTLGLRALFAVLCAALSTLLAGGCAQQAARQTGPEPIEFREAVRATTEDLFGQIQRSQNFVQLMQAKLAKRLFVIDPFIDADSGQVTAVSRVAEDIVNQLAREKFPEFQIKTLSQEDLPNAQFLISGTLSYEAFQGAKDAPAIKRYRLKLAATDIKTATVVAQSSAWVSNRDLDLNPTAAYRDSPMYLKDKTTQGYIQTTASPSGTRADPAYFDGLTTAALLTEANQAYNDGSYQKALTLYQKASSRPDGQQLRTYSGLYLTNWKLSRSQDAENAFGNLIGTGIATNNISVKFLYKVASTEFIQDPQITTQYRLWLRQIAKQVATKKICMDVIGHSSKSGGEAYNDRLSTQRAVVLTRLIEAEGKDIVGRLKPSGRGFRENIVGSGTDDSRDAIDRRVEFKLVNCS